jgi:elongation factor G
MLSGELAGAPVSGVRVRLVDGSYHTVDSSEMAFKIAGSMAFKQAYEAADPVLLEPIMEFDVLTPEEFMGDVLGDVTSRRGRIEQIEERTGVRAIRVQVPLAELFGYATDLRSKTQGRASHTPMQLTSYQEVPAQISKEIVARVRGE